jgi:hypothetical protein
MNEEKKPGRMISTNRIKVKSAEPVQRQPRFVTTSSPSKARLTGEIAGEDVEVVLGERRKKILAGLKKHREELALKIEKAGGKVRRTK